MEVYFRNLIKSELFYPTFAIAACEFVIIVFFCLGIEHKHSLFNDPITIGCDKYTQILFQDSYITIAGAVSIVYSSVIFILITGWERKRLICIQIGILVNLGLAIFGWIAYGNLKSSNHCPDGTPIAYKWHRHHIQIMTNATLVIAILTTVISAFSFFISITHRREAPPTTEETNPLAPEKSERTSAI